MRNPKDPGERLSAIMRALADHVGSVPDHTLLEEAASEHIDVKVEATRVRSLLLDGVLRAKKARLKEAARVHGAAVAELGSRVSRLPSTPEDRRMLLRRTLSQRPQMQEAVVTLQHREFESFTDADVESALKQLDALGMLDDISEHKP